MALVKVYLSCCVQGHPRLVKALAKVYSPLLKQELDPLTEVLVSVGAYGALFCIIQGMVNPGDEVSATEQSRAECRAKKQSRAEHRAQGRVEHNREQMAK